MQSVNVQEVQGLYGPFTISEKVLQKIWLQGEFYQEGLQTQSGKSLKVIHPGEWNKHEGPDFREARLEIGGREVIGDVEIHFDAGDWFHHGHDKDPNFGRVALHVVLYPFSAVESSGLPKDSLILMPLLERDLEEYAMEAALLDLEQVNELDWFEPFMERTLSERRALLKDLSGMRWMQKVAFFQKRLNRADWVQACHESALEVLGYARNRAVMHKIAASYGLDDFAAGLDADRLFHEHREEWKLSGCRPANHPKLRLQQYARICTANVDWPNQLLNLLDQAVMSDDGAVSDFRKLARTKDLESAVAEEVFQGVIASKRLATLLCDAIFPLADCALSENWSAHWQNWYPGDYPGSFSRFYREAGLGDDHEPMSNGIMQGILALFMTKGASLL